MISASFYRGADSPEGLYPRAGAMYDDVTEVEHSAKYALFDVDAFDLVEVHFNGASPHETDLAHDPLIGDGDLGRRSSQSAGTNNTNPISSPAMPTSWNAALPCAAA
jgi:hypothetical protein